MSLSTLDHFSYLLNQREDCSIQAFCQEALGNSMSNGELIAVQIHGEVLLSRDVESLYLVDHVLSSEEMNKLNEWKVDVVTIPN